MGCLTEPSFGVPGGVCRSLSDVLSPVTSKPASQGRIKPSHSEARVHIRFFDSSKGLFISCRGRLGASLPVNCLLD